MNLDLARKTLNGLTEDSRELSNKAYDQGDTNAALGLINIAITLRSARDQLDIDGANYLDAARAFIEAGRKMITDYKVKLMGNARADRVWAARDAAEAAR